MALQTWMAEALRLTRSGNLTEATALLRAALHHHDRDMSPPATTPSGILPDTISRRVSSEGRSDEPGTARTRADASPSSSHKAQAKGQFDEHVYRGAAGTMNYRLYVPPGAAAGMPLVVMLHGCTQSPEDFAQGTGMNRLADEFGFFVAYPRQTQAANPQKCWNWFRPGDQQRDRGEPALLAAVTRQTLSEYRLDSDRVYVAGLSAGGAAAAIMAAEYPDLFAAVGIHSGLACGAARDITTALSAMKRGGSSPGTGRLNRGFVPSISFHGDKDSTVHEANSREIVEAAIRAAGVPLDVKIEEGESDSGRPYLRELRVDGGGNVQIEHWTIKGAGHAWSGGDPSGSYTDPKGPVASREMVRFFLDRKRT